MADLFALPMRPSSPSSSVDTMQADGAGAGAGAAVPRRLKLRVEVVAPSKTFPPLRFFVASQPRCTVRELTLQVIQSFGQTFPDLPALRIAGLQDSHGFALSGGFIVGEHFNDMDLVTVVPVVMGSQHRSGEGRLVLGGEGDNAVVSQRAGVAQLSDIWRRTRSTSLQKVLAFCRESTDAGVVLQSSSSPMHPMDVVVSQMLQHGTMHLVAESLYAQQEDVQRDALQVLRLFFEHVNRPHHQQLGRISGVADGEGQMQTEHAFWSSSDSLSLLACMVSAALYCMRSLSIDVKLYAAHVVADMASHPLGRAELLKQNALPLLLESALQLHVKVIMPDADVAEDGLAAYTLGARDKDRQRQTKPPRWCPATANKYIITFRTAAEVASWLVNAQEEARGGGGGGDGLGNGANKGLMVTTPLSGRAGIRVARKMILSTATSLQALGYHTLAVCLRDDQQLQLWFYEQFCRQSDVSVLRAEDRMRCHEGSDGSEDGRLQQQQQQHGGDSDDATDAVPQRHRGRGGRGAAGALDEEHEEGGEGGVRGLWVRLLDHALGPFTEHAITASLKERRLAYEYQAESWPSAASVGALAALSTLCQNAQLHALLQAARIPSRLKLMIIADWSAYGVRDDGLALGAGSLEAQSQARTAAANALAVYLQSGGASHVKISHSAVLELCGSGSASLQRYFLGVVAQALLDELPLQPTEKVRAPGGGRIDPASPTRMSPAAGLDSHAYAPRQRHASSVFNFGHGSSRARSGSGSGGAGLGLGGGGGAGGGSGPGSGPSSPTYSHSRVSTSTVSELSSLVTRDTVWQWTAHEAGGGGAAATGHTAAAAGTEGKTARPVPVVLSRAELVEELLVLAGVIQPPSVRRAIDNAVQLEALAALARVALNHHLSAFLVQHDIVNRLAVLIEQGVGVEVRRLAAKCLAHLCTVDRQVKQQSMSVLAALASPANDSMTSVYLAMVFQT